MTALQAGIRGGVLALVGAAPVAGAIAIGNEETAAVVAALVWAGGFSAGLWAWLEGRFYG